MEKIELEKFRHGLKQYRKKNNILQKDIADSIGVTTQTISAYETGKYTITNDNIVKICKYLHVKKEDIMRLSNENSPISEAPCKEFGERLKKCRVFLHLTQGELASKTGLHQVQISDYEKGIRKPNEEHMQKLAKELHVTVEYLDLGEGESSLEKTKYGYEVKLKHVQKAYKNVKVDKRINSLSDDCKQCINELIDLLCKNN